MRKLTIVKGLLGLGGLALLCSSPAHAQFGGTIGGGSSLGVVRFQSLPSYAPHDYAVTNVSGSAEEYTPSTFLPFDEAVAEGTATYAPPKTVAEVAADMHAQKEAHEKAKVIVEQDTRGKVVACEQEKLSKQLLIFCGQIWLRATHSSKTPNQRPPPNA